ncbi:testis, partial [Huso huso]
TSSPYRASPRISQGMWGHSACRSNSPPWTMLSGVKDTLYHPHLPTLRRMDMDTDSTAPRSAIDSLSLSLSEDFRDWSSCCHKLPKRHFIVTDTFRNKYLRSTYPSTAEQRLLLDSTVAWSASRPSTGITLPMVDKAEPHFSGYSLRYLKPNTPKSWKFCLTHNPSLDQYGPKPMAFHTL